MAVAIMRKLVQEEDEEWRIASAGIWAIEGVPATYKAKLVVKNKGLDISDHRSQPIDWELIDSFDLILTMERSHKEALIAEFPPKAKQIYLLSEVIDQVYDVRDPIGMSLKDFQNTYDELEGTLKSGLDKIRQLVKP
jgi:protein-tyrosine-phosphatase